MNDETLQNIYDTVRLMNQTADWMRDDLKKVNETTHIEHYMHRIGRFNDKLTKLLEKSNA